MTLECLRSFARDLKHFGYDVRLVESGDDEFAHRGEQHALCLGPSPKAAPMTFFWLARNMKYDHWETGFGMDLSAIKEQLGGGTATEAVKRPDIGAVIAGCDPARHLRSIRSFADAAIATNCINHTVPALLRMLQDRTGCEASGEVLDAVRRLAGLGADLYLPTHVAAFLRSVDTRNRLQRLAQDLRDRLGLDAKVEALAIEIDGFSFDFDEDGYTGSRLV